MKGIKESYIEASKAYVRQEKTNGDVIGIIVSGSLIHSTIDKNSDIDIYVILDPRCQYRERGNTWINDIEIEYFKNPPSQIRTYFEREQKSPHTAHMLAHGEIIYQESDIVEGLKTEAIDLINQKPEKPRGFEIELSKYIIDDYYKDFEDALLNQNKFGATLIRNKIANKSIDIFCKKHQIRRSKDKRLSEQLETVDPQFLKTINSAIRTGSITLASMEELRMETDRLLGGRRSKEWKLKSELDI